MQIADKYSPQEIESKWYDYWIEKRLFHSEPDQREPYTIVIPPPNVTGMLHMGHMLNNTLQDVLVRRARMSGRNACWVPGMDHASIATEAKVVAMLHEKGIEKSSLSREKFLEYAWEWKEKYGGMILKQLRKLGASCDWERTCFTMDGPRTESVIKVFCDLFEKGRIYRGVRMVNWDPAAKTALSDEEVVFKESHGKLYYLRYKIEGTDKAIIVATTRPETILGDTALCVNPNDPRYASLPADARVIVPLVNRSIPVIRDEYVDIEFGTGALKVTPAHDVNDYMLGEKYGLETIDIFNDDGTINDKVGMYVGMDRFDVRKQIEKDLAAAGLLEKTEEYTNNVGYSERTGVAIEPKLSMQWFLSMEELARPATKAVMEDAIRFVPEKYKNTYRHWMENIKDWCISRQLWWGQRIPAYYLPKGGYVVAPTAEEALARMNAARQAGADALRTADRVILTFGTAWVYEHGGEVVANCHRRPAAEFSRRRLSVEEIAETFAELLEGPLAGKQIILTVSPVRHVGDTLPGNAVSKAVLRLAAEELKQRFGCVEYFPAYEIVTDDLRDYRFYADDLVHPAPQAVAYIWEKFAGTVLTDRARKLLPEVEAVVAAAAHRPRNPQGEAHRAFCRRQLERIAALPEVDFQSEAAGFRRCIEINS